MFTALLLYPGLHELGHLLAAVLFGGKVVEFHFFPLPNILCDGSSIGNAGLAAIGFCGMLVPFLISMIFHSKNFTFWYISQLMKGISVLAFGISLTSLLGQRHGVSVANDDMTTVLRFWPDGRTICIIVITVLMLLAVYSICRQRPMKRLYKYFGINEK